MVAQVQDDFSDGDFTVSPTWSGSTSAFIINGSNQLQSNGSTTGDEIYLTTSNTLIDSVNYDFYLHLDFNPTETGNFVKIYLVSDQSDLTGSLNGYYLRLGETNSPDTLELWRQDGASNTKILTGTKGFTSTTDVSVRVVRDHLGNWELLTDHSAGSNYTSEGTVLDATHTTTTHFGVYCKYSTGSRFNQYFFDNINIEKIPEDLTPPEVDSVVVVSSTELDVFFSEGVTSITAQDINNYSVDISIGIPLTAIRDAVDTSIVHLTFSTAFTNGETYNLVVNNVEDGNSNVISANSTSFFYFEAVAATRGDVVINEIFADPSPQIGLPAVEYLELYNASNTIFNLLNWKYVNSTTVKTIDTAFYLYPDTFVILCADADTALFSNYGNVLGITGTWTALTNSADSLTILDELGTVIDVVDYDISWYGDDIKDDGGYSLELINPSPVCVSGANNWIASNDATGGTPGKQNSVYNNTPDVTSPTVLDISPSSSSKLEITFSEAMDSLAVVSGTFTFDNGLIAQSITVTDNYTTAEISLNNLIVEGIIYNVTISNMTDCSGNALSTTINEFFIGSEPQIDEVIITEIFADPTPSVGLPTVEYIEIYNTSNKLIDLTGTDYEGTIITNGSMQVGDYIILCANADTALFSPYGKVIGLSVWPTLTNSGETLTLKNASGVTIDEVTYDINWYDDDLKNDGGYSLELINPEASCSGGASNWTASNAAIGGTPGTQNSVFDNSPDVTSPDLESIEILSDTSIIINFSEPMDTTSLLAGTYSISGSLSITDVALNSSDFTDVILYLSASFDTAVTYIVITSNVIDCPGNPISINNSGNFVVGYRPEAGEVIINEIFADPTPALVFPEGEFVELYNKTNKLFDISGYSFDGATISKGFIQPNGYVVLCDDSDTTGFGLLGGDIIGLTSFPSLTNAGELITFEAPDGATIDEVEYDINWHTEDSKEDGGWSLELINPDNPCSSINNWGSSISFDGATPGIVNSIYNTAPDVTAPELSSIAITGSSFVVVTFNEPIDTTNLFSLTINTTPSLSVNAVGVSGSLGDKIYIGFTTDIDTAVAYTIQIANMEDCMENVNTTGSSLTFEIGHSPYAGDIVINEIFADPSPIIGLPEAEYIELFNISNKKIDLSNAQINGKSISYYLLEPNSYVILVNDDDTSLFTAYNNVAYINSWTALNNTSMKLTLTNNNGNTVDEVYYFNSWYNDDEKDGGGWSLERKNPESDCNFANNWEASTDSKGGTPGSINSIYNTDADIITPNISKIEVVDSVTLNIIFSESMDANSLYNGIYTISNGYKTINYNVDSNDFASVQITLDSYLIEGSLETLSIDSVYDCPGNLIKNNTTNFVLPQQGNEGDLIINEVLFNPTTDGVDFVEVYNNSTKYIDLGTWYLANFDNDTVSNIKSISSNQQIIAPGDFTAISKDSNAVKFSYPLNVGGNFVQATTLPTYSNSDGTVILLNNNFEVMDQFNYDENMHFAILNDVDGVSLERIDFDRETNDETNWHSAAENVGFATPGLPNSQYQPANPGDGILTVEPEIFSPDEDGYNDVLNISYKLDGPSYVGNITIYDAKGRIVRNLMANEYLSPEGTISWDGKTDQNEKARIGIYIIFAEFYNETGDILKSKEACVLGTNL